MSQVDIFIQERVSAGSGTFTAQDVRHCLALFEEDLRRRADEAFASLCEMRSGACCLEGGRCTSDCSFANVLLIPISCR